MATSDILDQLAQQFCITTGELLDENAKYIGDLRKAGDIDIEEAALNNAAEIIKNMSATELLDEFIDCHDDWHQMSVPDEKNVEDSRERIMQFILETVPKTYKNVPFDVELLTISVERYKSHKKAGNFKGEPNEANWPVNTDDIDNMRLYFVTMITIACEYIFAGRKGSLSADGSKLVYANPSFKQNIPLEEYVKMFDIKLA
jgi:hypothetical protein